MEVHLRVLKSIFMRRWRALDWMAKKLSGVCLMSLLAYLSPCTEFWHTHKHRYLSGEQIILMYDNKTFLTCGFGPYHVFQHD